MLDSEILVNLLPELGIGMDLMMRGRCSGERFMCGTGWSVQLASSVSALRSETNEFHKSPSSAMPDSHPRGSPPYVLRTAALLQMP